MELQSSDFVFTLDAAYDRLRSDFALAYPELDEDINLMFFAWPTLHALVARAAFFVSPSFPGKKKGLLVDALHAATKARGRRAPMEAFEEISLGFLTELSRGFSSTELFGITSDGEQHRWRMYDPPICKWATGWDSIIVTSRTSTSEMIGANILLLAGRLMSAEEIAMVPSLLPCENSLQKKTRPRKAASARTAVG